MRLALAVATGYLIFAISAALLFQLTGQDPHATPGPVFGVASVVWGILFATLGGYMAARIARMGSLMPGFMVGCVIAVGAMASLMAGYRQGSIWSQLSALLLMAPAAYGGGLINLRKQR